MKVIKLSKKGITMNITKILENSILTEEKKRAKEHKSSGKLSASMLGMPTQWQILKHLGIKPTEFTMRTMLVFKRGRDVEDMLIASVREKHEVKDQVACKYRDCVGYLDMLVDGNAIEIKSTNTMAYRHILKENNAKKGHALQAGLYGLALDMKEFKVCYVNTDTYQTITFTYKTKDFKKEIDGIIDFYNECIRKKKIPLYTAIERWNSLPNYQKYPDYAKLDKNELYTIADELYSPK